MTDLVDPRTGIPRERPRVVSSPADVDAAVVEARAAAATWGRMTPGARAGALGRLADAIEAGAGSPSTPGRLAVAEQAGTGKPTYQAVEEIRAAADVFRFYGGAARVATAPAAGVWIDDHWSYVVDEPLGTIAAILPWNYPAVMLAWRTAPALAAGNTVVVKPAIETSDTARMIESLALDAGLPAGTLVVVEGDDETGRALVASAIDGVAFTGSTTAGVEVARAAAPLPVSLELGGNAPVLVYPDAPRGTASLIVGASTYNAGQSCAAPARIILVGDNDRFLAELIAAVTSTDAALFGPVISAEAMLRIEETIAASAAYRVYRGRAPSVGYHVAAALLVDPDPMDAVVRSEVFGPVLTVEQVKTEAEAIAYANRYPGGLGASVHTADHDRAVRAAREIRAGEVWVNTHLVQTPELPHSGRGLSGQGTDLSARALDEWRRHKTVTARVL